MELDDGEWRDFLLALLPLPLCFLPCRSRLLDFRSLLSRRLLLDSFNRPSTRDEMPVEVVVEAGVEVDEREEVEETAEGERDEVDREDEKAEGARDGVEDDRGATGTTEGEEDDRVATGAMGSRRGTTATGDRGADMAIGREWERESARRSAMLSKDERRHRRASEVHNRAEWKDSGNSTTDTERARDRRVTSRSGWSQQ